MDARREIKSQYWKRACIKRALLKRGTSIGYAMRQSLGCMTAKSTTAHSDLSRWYSETQVVPVVKFFVILEVH